MLTTVVKEVAAAYDATGAAWRHGPGPIYGRLAEVLCDKLTFDLRGWQVLDLGSGTGAASDTARRRGAVVVALDIAAGMLRARTDVAVPAVAGDARCLPFRASSFHAAVAAFSLNHLVDPPEALRELDRVVRRGGVAVVGAYAEGDGHPVRAAVRAAAAAAGWIPPAWEAVLRASAIPRLATPGRALRAATAAGIRSAVATCVEVPFPNLSAADLVAWRLGMAQMAPFVASLTAAQHEQLVADACARLGSAWPPVVRTIVVLTWHVDDAAGPRRHA